MMATPRGGHGHVAGIGQDDGFRGRGHIHRYEQRNFPMLANKQRELLCHPGGGGGNATAAAVSRRREGDRVGGCGGRGLVRAQENGAREHGVGFGLQHERYGGPRTASPRLKAHGNVMR